MRTPSGAVMSSPPGWQPLHGDTGTATMARLSARRQILGYLNLTPRQGDESLAGWATFRVAHNREEGDRQVTRIAAAGGLRFRSGRGSCVSDRYVTAVGTRYVEIACLVQGRRTSVVVVGASPPAQWGTVSPLLEQAISSLTT